MGPEQGRGPPSGVHSLVGDPQPNRCPCRCNSNTDEGCEVGDTGPGGGSLGPWWGGRVFNKDSPAMWLQRCLDVLGRA